ncbi:gliding motility protein GldL [Daejeonella sp.]|uniref:type IX secretion system motor protein PorL/GldL n=1 Tax=Daejeonella sp. TaxID=2805397 RepID=UPI00271DD75B|nr:gliding motility protein GldL [Daejeonella sp.]MDO8993429.1 gliding motility protein GldL [Daejeonella sp.]MDP2412539.1 gliding motility protein GldL [Daejeonella sp.]
MAQKKKFKLGINTLISWGASVVIVGLMFKILHWQGGEIMIAVGLITEAILFFILGFQAESTDPDWTRVYPELDEEFKGDLAQASLSGSGSSTAALDKMMVEAKIGPELIESLGSGLRSFGDKVSAISGIADTASATTELAAKVKTASGSFDSLNTAFDKATVSLREMADTNIDSKSYHEQVNNLARNISALNAVYELELQDSSAHLKSMNKFYQNLSLTMQNFNESMEDSKQFKEEVGKLAKNLSSLNSIYGNMLSAMNQPNR